MKRIVTVLLFGLLFLLNSCGETTVYTGPEVKAGPVDVALTIDSNGNIVLTGAYTQPIASIEVVGQRLLTPSSSP